MPDYSNTRIQLRRGTAAEWSTNNPVLGEGEPGYDLTNKIFKIGDGTTRWASLSGVSGASGASGSLTQEDLDQAISNLIDSAPETLDTLNEIAAAINDNASFFEAVAYSGGDISQFNNDNNYIISDTTVAFGSEEINNVISLSQSEYDLITPQTGVLYVIDDAPTPAISGENISQFTNDAGYLTAETNDLTNTVTWTNVPDANITESAVVQHSGALRLTESQIVDLGDYVASGDNISQFNNDSSYIPSSTSGITGASGVNNIVIISSDDYATLPTKDPNTIYFVP